MHPTFLAALFLLAAMAAALPTPPFKDQYTPDALTETQLDLVMQAINSASYRAPSKPSKVKEIPITPLPTKQAQLAQDFTTSPIFPFRDAHMNTYLESVNVPLPDEDIRHAGYRSDLSLSIPLSSTGNFKPATIQDTKMDTSIDSLFSDLFIPEQNSDPPTPQNWLVALRLAHAATERAKRLSKLDTPRVRFLSRFSQNEKDMLRRKYWDNTDNYAMWL